MTGKLFVKYFIFLVFNIVINKMIKQRYKNKDIKNK